MRVKLQVVIRFELARRLGSKDPIDGITLLHVKRHAALIAVLLSDRSCEHTVQEFLDTVLYKQYGSVFPITVLEIYEDLDVRPPRQLFAAAEMYELCESPVLMECDEVFSNTILFDCGSAEDEDGSVLMSMMSNEGSLKRRRTISGHIASSSRLEHQVQWTRSLAGVEVKRRKSDGRYVPLGTISTRPIRSHLSSVIVEASPNRCNDVVLMARPSIGESPMVRNPLQIHAKYLSPILNKRRSSLNTASVHRALSFDEDVSPGLRDRSI